MKPIVILMTNTLRLDDNPALSAACAEGVPVIPVYILDEETVGTRPYGAARRWWLLKSLKELSKQLTSLGSALIIRKGITLRVVQALLEETGASIVHLTRSYEHWARESEADIDDLCISQGGSCRRFTGNLLIEPEHIQTKTGKPYEVFTPFWRTAKGLITGTPVNPPVNIIAPDKWPVSLDISDLSFEPCPASWAMPLARIWQPGEIAAHERLDMFLGGIVDHYKIGRDVPAKEATSRLSPYLTNGEISARRVYFEAKNVLDKRPAAVENITSFIREIGWREFNNHLLYHFPHMPAQPLKPKFERFPWQQGQGLLLKAWQEGKTGFPIIDAGMRQLWQTGWMHNRVRMIVASFLVKDMLWHWREGEAWFWDTLVDADVANNAAGWQWVAGCGADAAPYFRIFNPILQSEKFDKEGQYIREFLPELSALPNAYIHKPFDAPQAVLKTAGIELGKTYPFPILNRQKARMRALGALEATKL